MSAQDRIAELSLLAVVWSLVGIAECQRRKAKARKRWKLARFHS